jgi:transcriptional regulator with XRE-family HTH domain
MEEKGSKRFGAFLRKLREDRRLTLDAIEELSSAHRDRISKTYLSRCENGRTLPSFTKLFTLSKIYKTRLTGLAERLELDVELEEMPAIDLSGTSFEELTSKGNEEVQHGNIKRAFLLYNAAWDMASLEEKPADRADKESRARLSLAIALFRLGRLEMAEEECKTIISLPDVTQYLLRRAFVLLAAVYYENNRHELTRIMVEQAYAKIDPGDERSTADILSMQGLLHFESGKLEEARADLERARQGYEKMKDDFSLCKTFANSAEVEAAAHNLDAALTLFNRSLDIARNLGYQYYVAKRLHDIGLLHHGRGRGDLASKNFYESNEISRRAEYYDITFLNCFYLWKMAKAKGDRSGAALNEKSLRFFAFKIEKSFPELDEFKAYLEKGKGKP